MLSELHIENIAIIDRLDAEFEKGFTVLTGETGAGKSIIVDSIMLLLGNKASKELIRTGAEAGVVSACFTELSNEALAILNENGFSPDEDGNVVVFRKIGADGKNTARINGVSVTVSLLRQLGEHLINIHGQHDGVLLLDSNRHLGYLDDFGNYDDVILEYKDSFARVKELRDRLNALKLEQETKERRRAELTSWLEELDGCALKEGEYDTLLIKRKGLMNNSEITEALHVASVALYEEDHSSAPLAKVALDAIQSVREILPNSKDIEERLIQVCSELDDLGAEIGKRFDSYMNDQMDPEVIESRLDKLEGIRKKFGPDDKTVLKKQADYHQELDRMEQSESLIEEAEGQFNEARRNLEASANKLTAVRKKAAQTLEKCLLNELCYLDMPKVSFEIRVEDRLNERGGYRYRSDGKDEVEFFISANQGEKVRPLSKIASGGELSRVMLSMKCVLAKGADTLIYDEVDTGVSGSTAEKIGKKLHGSAHNQQVFSITHLAQIAALADHHFKVQKTEQNNRVCSTLMKLNQNQRVAEIARIMGGEELSETLLRSAEEMVANNKNNY